MPRDIKLYSDDPVIFAMCPGRCNKTGIGRAVDHLFYRAYSRGAWKRRPKCDNCKSNMIYLYEVE